MYGCNFVQTLHVGCGVVLRPLLQRIQLLQALRYTLCLLHFPCVQQHDSLAGQILCRCDSVMIL